MMTFKNPRWPLHFALAWVLTRDEKLCEKALNTEFSPRRSSTEWSPADEAGFAWQIFFSALRAGKVVAYGRPIFMDSLDSKKSAEIEIPRADYFFLDWDNTRHDGSILKPQRRLMMKMPREKQRDIPSYVDVAIDSKSMIEAFPSDRTPVAFTSKHIGQPKSVDGSGFIALSDAAYWLATKGGAEQINPRDISFWRTSFGSLVEEISGDEIAVIGRRNGIGTPEKVDGLKFSGIKINYPYGPTPPELDSNDAPYLDCCGPISGAELEMSFDDNWKGCCRPFTGKEWEKGYTDRLYAGDRGPPEYTHLQVSKADVRKKWPFNIAIDRSEEKTTRSKALLIKEYLDKKFPESEYPDGVPKPGLAPRYLLIRELIADWRMGKSCDEGTLLNAIKEFNAERIKRRTTRTQKKVDLK